MAGVPNVVRQRGVFDEERRIPRFTNQLRHAGFAVQGMTASYEVITDTIVKIGPSLAQRFAVPAYCSLKGKDEEQSLFVALAWCEAIGMPQ